MYAKPFEIAFVLYVYRTYVHRIQSIRSRRAISDHAMGIRLLE